MEQHGKSTELNRVEAQRRLAKAWPMWKAVLERERHTLKSKTILQYTKASQRMHATGLAPEVIGKMNRRSFNLYRAAIIYDAQCQLDRLHQDMTDGFHGQTEAVHAMLAEVERNLAVLERYPPHNSTDPSLWRRPVGGPSSKSKRAGLGKRPPEWRMIMCSEAAPGTPFHKALLVLALTGARPSEIQQGVLVSLTAGGNLEFVISGSKVTGTTGQAWRKFDIRVDNPIAWQLADVVLREPSDADQVTISIVNARDFCDDVKALSRIVFPKQKNAISPYSFRHQLAADLKARGISAEMLAAVMGHQSGRSARAYGAARQGGRCPLTNLVSVAAATEIRHTVRLPGLTQATQTKASKSRAAAAGAIVLIGK